MVWCSSGVGTSVTMGRSASAAPSQTCRTQMSMWAGKIRFRVEITRFQSWISAIERCQMTQICYTRKERTLAINSIYEGIMYFNLHGCSFLTSNVHNTIRGKLGNENTKNLLFALFRLTRDLGILEGTRVAMVVLRCGPGGPWQDRVWLVS
jgi:hypothetical protein